jgi:hypothetical protein
LDAVGYLELAVRRFPDREDEEGKNRENEGSESVKERTLIDIL